MRHSLRRLTSPLRALPDALVIGGMRCGSTSFYRWLGGHPNVVASSRKEVHFFDLHFDRGVNWYRTFFPFRGSDVLTFDATPSYMAHPEAVSRAMKVVPNARLIALLRDPTERAWSHYRFRRSQGYESRTFVEAIESELLSAGDVALAPFSAAAEISVLAAGLYANQLRPWLDAFGQDRILVLDANRMFEEASEAWEETQAFLGLRSVGRRFDQVNASPGELLDAEVMSAVDEYYAEPNRELRELIGARFEWLD